MSKSAAAGTPRGAGKDGLGAHQQRALGKQQIPPDCQSSRARGTGGLPDGQRPQQLLRHGWGAFPAPIVGLGIPRLAGRCQEYHQVQPSSGESFVQQLACR